MHFTCISVYFACWEQKNVGSWSVSAAIGASALEQQREQSGSVGRAAAERVRTGDSGGRQTRSGQRTETPGLFALQTGLSPPLLPSLPPLSTHCYSFSAFCGNWFTINRWLICIYCMYRICSRRKASARNRSRRVSTSSRSSSGTPGRDSAAWRRSALSALALYLHIISFFPYTGCTELSLLFN